jgi:hypothetical protein
VNNNKKRKGIVIMQDLGKLVTSGDCKGHSVIKQVWGTYLGIGIFLIILGLILGVVFEGDILVLGNFGLDLGVISRIGGFVLAFFCLINAVAYVSQVSKTEINVFERGISGLGINPKDVSERFTFPIFKTPQYALSEFSLSYDQISSVSKAEQQGVNINVEGVIYVVLVSNLDEIMQAINSRMKKR